MKKILATLLLFMSIIGYSQTNGITYQAVIMNPSGEQLPGVNNTNAPLANKNICLKFSIIDYNSQSEYIETVQTTTDEYGMVNLVIGTGVQIGGYASSFSNILWNVNPKSLKVDLSTTGICSYFTEISNQPFTAVPFALYAVNSESAAALAALQATVAANATATTAALALKEDAVNKSTTTTLGTSNVLFPTQNAVKTYVDSNITTVNTNNTALQAIVTVNATATTAALALKEDAVNKSTITTLGTSNILFPTQNAVKTYVDTNITSVNANNTALQATVASNATTTTAALALKEDAINKSTTTTLGTSNVLFPTQNAVKTYVDTNITTVNSNNTVLQATVTANATATTAALTLKEDAVNKSTITTLGTSNILFPTQNAVKTYVDSNITSVNANNTALQATVVANATATTAALALKEDAINKSTTTTLGTSNVLFPTQNAVKTYVDSQVASATIPDANATTKGKIKLAGDLGGTADAPTVPALVNKENTINAGTTSQYYRGDKTWQTLDKTAVGLANVDNTTDATKPISAATQTALALKEDAINKSSITTLGTSNVLFPTQNAVKTYVDTNITTVNATNVALQATITSNAAATTTALGFKEDAINKSTDVTLADVSNTKFPTELAVKTFITNRIANGTAANVSGIVGIANGGTGSVTQNFVDLTTNQNISGVKTFSSDATGTNVPDINLIVSKTSGSMAGTNNFLSVETVINPFVYSSQGIIIRKDDGAKRGFKLGQEGSNDGDSVFKIASFSDSADFNRFVIRRDNGNIGIGNSSPTEKLEVTGNLKTSGTITAGAITIPNTDGTPNQVLITNGSGSLSWSTPSPGGATTVGAIDSASNANGASITASELKLAPADATNGGIVTTGTQTFSGAKYFTTNITANQVSIGSPGIGSQNTMLGESSFGYASPGSNNTGLGFFTLASLNGGNDNTAVGTNAIRQGGTANGSRNTAVGSVALSNGSEPNDNTALGYATLAVTSGSSNTAVGSSVLQNNTTASYNVGVGFETLRNTTTGGSNTAVGRGAMYSNTSGDVNTAVGEYALVSNTNGRYNTSIGVQAQEQNTTGQSNTAIGVAAIDRNTSGSNNAILGAFAGRYTNDGSTFNTEINNSVLIGAESTPKASNESNQIVIGYQAKGNGSNTIQLGNTSITNVNTSGSITANAEISSEITANLTIDNANAEQYKAKVLICNPTSPITITFGNDLPVGFNCMVLQKSIDANKINLAGGSGVTIKNRSNFTATAGNYAIATIVNIGGGIIVTAGDMQ